MIPCSRRSFLRASAAGLGLLHAPFSLARPSQALGVGLYTVRAALAADTAGTLNKLKALGYDKVEPAGFAGQTPRTFRAMAADSGLTLPSCHMLPEIWYANPEGTLDAIAEVGAKHAVLAWVPDAKREGAALAATLNAWGALAKQRGLIMAYHNHEFEFTMRQGGATLFDTLLKLTDPALVDFELDVFWAKQGGHDPLLVFKRHAKRISMLHLKDMAKNGKQTSVGAGTIDFKALLAHARKTGVAHLFVEQDDPLAPFDALGHSIRHLKSI